MAALFPPWSNTALRLGLVLCACLVLAIPIALMVWVRTPMARGQNNPTQQPVEFDHRHHVSDDGIDCRYCHDLAERSRYAGVPPAERCMGCHNQIATESPLLSLVQTSYWEGKGIAWQRVHRLPSFVYFHHAIHVTRGIGCESCHGRVDRMARVTQVAPLTMGWCLDCHRAPERHLRPLSAITKMGYEREAGVAEELARAYGTRRLVHCTACHR